MNKKFDNSHYLLLKLKNIDSTLISENMLGLLLFSLPISIALNSICLVIILITGLLYKLMDCSWIKSIKIYWPCLFLFGIQLIGYLNSDFSIEADKKLLLYASLLILPLLPLGNRKLSANKIFGFMVIGVVLISIYAFGRGAYDIFVLGVRYDYGRAPELLLKYLPHHVYFSLYVLCSVLVISKMVGDGKLSNKFLLLLPLFYINLLVLPSRIALILAFLVLPFFIFKFLSKRFSKQQLALCLTGTILLFTTVGMSLDFTRDKIVYTVYELVEKETREKPFYGIDLRKKIWESSVDVIKEAPVIGYGIGDSQHVLNQQYLVNGYKEIVGMNAHNQYLQNLIQYGALLTSLFFGVIIWLLIKLWDKRQLMLIAIWITISIIFITESILNRQWGVVFFVVLLAISVNHAGIGK